LLLSHDVTKLRPSGLSGKTACLLYKYGKLFTKNGIKIKEILLNSDFFCESCPSDHGTQTFKDKKIPDCCGKSVNLQDYFLEVWKFATLR
jgi:hypothetical protein